MLLKAKPKKFYYAPAVWGKAAAGGGEGTVLFDASSTTMPIGAGSGTSWSSSTPINVGSGSNGTTNLCLLAALMFIGSNGGTNTSPALNWDFSATNQAMTLVPSASIGNGASAGDIFWFYLMNPTLGSKIFHATWAGGTSGPTIAAVSFVGVDQTGGATSFPNVVTNTGSGTTASVSITASPTTRKIVAAFTTPQGFSTASGTDIGHQNAGSVFAGSANWDNGTATSLSYTQSSSTFDAVAFSIKGA